MILGPNHLHTSLKADFHQDIIQVFKQVQFPQANMYSIKAQEIQLSFDRDLPSNK